MVERLRARSGQIEDLLERIERLVTLVGNGKVPSHEESQAGGELRYCALPKVPQRTFGPEVSPHRGAHPDDVQEMGQRDQTSILVLR
jgi:hypothetical protein